MQQEYNYHDFHTPMLEDPDFEAKPLVMVMGQYSTGKTTFIRLSKIFIMLKGALFTELSFRCCSN